VTERLRATREGIAAAAAILREGGLVAFPTDTVYGVAVAASRRDRLDSLFALKHRPLDRRIPMLVADLDSLPSTWIVDDRARALADRFWPGALTLVLPAEEAGGESQAFRAPDHPVAQALIREAGPLLATSANISDQPDTLDADEVLVAFATQNVELDAVLDGGPVPGGVASTVVDLTGPQARILREGPIAPTMLAEVVALSD
jgi:L-threonylcarbamoyladenylate synthase